MSNETMRAEFEKVIGGIGYVSERCGDGYRFEEVEVAWQAWKAARTQSAEARPFAYAYEFVDPISGRPVWRFDTGPWNAQRPKSTKPLYTHPPAREQVPAKGWTPCSERLPTEADGPYVWVWDKHVDKATVQPTSAAAKFLEKFEAWRCPCWKPTGLTRPEPPEVE